MHKLNKIFSTPNHEVLDDAIFSTIKKELGDIPKTNEGIEKIYEWKEKNFINDKEGKVQRRIGEVTVQELFTGEGFPKRIKGCHQHGLVLKTILEKYGFSVKIIETIDKNGAYHKDKKVFSGHVLLRVFVEGKWKIVDTTRDSRLGIFLEQNPVTGIIDNKRFPFAEGNTLAEIGIVDKNSREKLKIKANKNIEKTKIKYMMQYTKKKILEILNIGPKKENQISDGKVYR